MSEEREPREPTEQEQADLDEAARMLLGMTKPPKGPQEGEPVSA